MQGVQISQQKLQLFVAINASKRFWIKHLPLCEVFVRFHHGIRWGGTSGELKGYSSEDRHVCNRWDWTALSLTIYYLDDSLVFSAPLKDLQKMVLFFLTVQRTSFRTNHLDDAEVRFPGWSKGGSLDDRVSKIP